MTPLSKRALRNGAITFPSLINNPTGLFSGSKYPPFTPARQFSRCIDRREIVFARRIIDHAQSGGFRGKQGEIECRSFVGFALGEHDLPMFDAGRGPSFRLRRL